jgi:DNA-directed RNA polymerase specialized sigma24 family protein
VDVSAYRTLRAQARRLARSAEDADDLVQDVLIVALESGRSDLPWLSGTLRNLAAMQARSAVCRRRREAIVSTEASAAAETVPTTCDAQQLLHQMPPAARRVAILALHGLGGDEIRWILGLSATAFRQRLTSIRKALGTLPPTLRAEMLALAYMRDPSRSVDLQFGLVRRALKAALGGEAGLGTHDADGHLLILRPAAHTSSSGGNE